MLFAVVCTRHIFDFEVQAHWCKGSVTCAAWDPAWRFEHYKLVQEAISDICPQELACKMLLASTSLFRMRSRSARHC